MEKINFFANPLTTNNPLFIFNHTIKPLLEHPKYPLEPFFATLNGNNLNKVLRDLYPESLPQWEPDCEENIIFIIHIIQTTSSCLILEDPETGEIKFELPLTRVIRNSDFSAIMDPHLSTNPNLKIRFQ